MNVDFKSHRQQLRLGVEIEQIPSGTGWVVVGVRLEQAKCLVCFSALVATMHSDRHISCKKTLYCEHVRAAFAGSSMGNVYCFTSRIDHVLQTLKTLNDKGYLHVREARAL